MKIQIKVNVRQLDGTYKRQSVYGNTMPEVTEKAEKLKAKAESAYQRALRPKFSELADEWLEVHELEVSHYTYSCYLAPLKDLKEEFSEYTVDEIKPIDIQRFLKQMQRKGFAKQTIKLRLIVIRQIFDYAITDKGIIEFNPATAIKPPKDAPRTEREPAADEDIRKVIQSVDVPFGLFPFLLYYTGCRRGEALALTYDDIDFENDLIHINKVLIFKNNKPYIEHRTKSKSGIRSIPLLKPLKGVLNKNGKGYLFANKNGELLSLSEYERAYSQYRKLTGVSATPHQFRHSFATMCYDAGLADKDTADILGHSKIELTRNIYTHIRESRRKSFTDKLNEQAIK